MTKKLKDLLERAETWPEQDQEELAEYSREIEARRTGTYVLSDDERVAVDEGLSQLRRGQFVSEKEMQVFWKKFGVV